MNVSVDREDRNKCQRMRFNLFVFYFLAIILNIGPSLYGSVAEHDRNSDEDEDDSSLEEGLIQYEENPLATYGFEMSTAHIEVISTKFYLRVKGVENLGQLVSDEFVLQRVKCKVVLAKKFKPPVKCDDGAYLAISLHMHGDDMPVDVARRVSVKFNLISPIKSLSKRTTLWWCWYHSIGFDRFIKWSSLMDESKQFVVNNQALLEITVDVGEPSARCFAEEVIRDRLPSKEEITAGTDSNSTDCLISKRYSLDNEPQDLDVSDMRWTS